MLCKSWKSLSPIGRNSTREIYRLNYIWEDCAGHMKCLNFGDLWHSWKPLTNCITFFIVDCLNAGTHAIFLGFYVLALENCVWPRNISKIMGIGKSYWFSLDYYILLIGVNIFYICFSAPNMLLNFGFSWCLSMSTNQKWPFLVLKYFALQLYRGETYILGLWTYKYFCDFPCTLKNEVYWPHLYL